MTANEAGIEVAKQMEPQERLIRAGAPWPGMGASQSPAFEAIPEAGRVHRHIREAQAG